LSSACTHKKGPFLTLFCKEDHCKIVCKIAALYKILESLGATTKEEALAEAKCIIVKELKSMLGSVLEK